MQGVPCRSPGACGKPGREGSAVLFVNRRTCGPVPDRASRLVVDGAWWPTPDGLAMAGLARVQADRRTKSGIGCWTRCSRRRDQVEDPWVVAIDTNPQPEKARPRGRSVGAAHRLPSSRRRALPSGTTSVCRDRTTRSSARGRLPSSDADADAFARRQRNLVEHEVGEIRGAMGRGSR